MLEGGAGGVKARRYGFNFTRMLLTGYIYPGINHALLVWRSMWRQIPASIFRVRPKGAPASRCRWRCIHALVEAAHDHARSERRCNGAGCR